MESTSYTVNAQGQRTNADVPVDAAILKANPTQSSEVEIAASVPLPGSPAQNDIDVVASDESKPQTEKVEEITAEQPSRKGLLETPVRPNVSMHLKMDASQKQSMADKTGNSLLRVQARAEQSIADKLGGRRSLSTKAVAATSIPAVQSEIAQISSDLMALKMNAAFKRSIADRLGDENLRREAQIAQSIADKMGARKAMLQSGKIAQHQGRAFVEQINRVQPARPAVAPQQTFSPKSALKLTAAVTRSIADRLDNAELREEARRKQSQADKAGARRALLQTGPVTKLAVSAPAAAATATDKKGLLKKPSVAFVAKAKGVPQSPIILDGHPRAISCFGCGASFPMSPTAVGPSLSSHLKEFPDHQKLLEEVPEKDRVYVAKENYKGRFDHNFADPLNFVLADVATTTATTTTTKLEAVPVAPATAANAAL